MRKKAAAGFCRDCGYQFARDDTECRMCARFEQLRMETAVLRGPAAPSEYRAILAQRRARTPSADGQSLRPAASVLRALTSPVPATSAMEAPMAGLGGEARAPKEESATVRKARPAPTAPPDGPTPMLIRLRTPQAPAIVTADAPTATLAGESSARPEKSLGRRESRSMSPPNRDDVPSLSAGVKETEAPEVPRAYRAARPRPVGHHAASSVHGYPWKTSLWVALGGGLVGASVALLSSMIR